MGSTFQCLELYLLFNISEVYAILKQLCKKVLINAQKRSRVFAKWGINCQRNANNWRKRSQNLGDTSALGYGAIAQNTRWSVQCKFVEETK